MKKTLVFMTVLLASLALVFANGAKEEADKVSAQSSDGIGTPDKPVEVSRRDLRRRASTSISLFFQLRQVLISL